jgi:hypothetical protein
MGKLPNWRCSRLHSSKLLKLYRWSVYQTLISVANTIYIWPSHNPKTTCVTTSENILVTRLQLKFVTEPSAREWITNSWLAAAPRVLVSSKASDRDSQILKTCSVHPIRLEPFPVRLRISVIPELIYEMKTAHESWHLLALHLFPVAKFIYLTFKRPMPPRFLSGAMSPKLF